MSVQILYSTIAIKMQSVEICQERTVASAKQATSTSPRLFQVADVHVRTFLHNMIKKSVI